MTTLADDLAALQTAGVRALISLIARPLLWAQIAQTTCSNLAFGSAQLLGIRDPDTGDLPK